MKLLLLGNTGQLGSDLQEFLPRLGTLRGLDYPEIDMADVDSIRTVVRDAAPDVIINATAYTAVDRAEREPELALRINGQGPGFLAEEARRCNALLIHYSTDYVFNGKKDKPYLENDLTSPLGIYGQSKLEGEKAVQQVHANYLIFRTSWVYSLRNDSGFVKKVLQWSRQHETLRIVDDQISSPTWSRMLAEMTVKVLEKGTNYIQERQGLYHLAGAGYTSRYEWAKIILALDPNREEQTAHQILPAKSIDFPTPAQRPAFSAMDCSLFEETFEIEIPAWEESLREAMIV